MKSFQQQANRLDGHLASSAARDPVAYCAGDPLDQNAIEQVGIDLGSGRQLDEGDQEREHVRFVRRFGFDLSDQILNSLETLHGSQFTDRSAVLPTSR